MTMLSPIRRHASYANIAATLALVFSMSGGALAASRYLITSAKKQISHGALAEISAKAKGATGKTGAAGSNGTNGTNGTNGAAGEKGPQGERGPQGLPGETGYTPFLPSGKSERGTWAFTGKGQEENETESRVFVSISFPIPLKEALTAEHVHFIFAEETAPEGCTNGTYDEPIAEPGNLCVYVNNNPANQLTGAEFKEIVNPESSLFPPEGAGKGGALLHFGSVTYSGKGFGDWVVTAK